MLSRIMFVDDDENILQAFKRILRGRYELTFHTKASDAIAELESNKENPYAVIVSDFRMPEIDGAKFLARAKQIVPNTVRILLTGYADINAAISVINEGNIFRFMTKPCPNETLINAIEEGIKQYKLIIAEKELLAETLKGTIRLLVDILSAMNPIVFSRANKVRNLCKNIARRLDAHNLWEVEISALLSMVGCVTVPTEIIEKRFSFKPMTEQEKNVFDKQLTIANSFIKNIPRLEGIANAISLSNKTTFELPGTPFNGELGPELIGNLIKLANDYFDQVEMGKTTEQIRLYFEENSAKYYKTYLSALEAEIRGFEQGFVIKEVHLTDLMPGDILADNITDDSGRVLVSKGIAITQVLKLRLANFSEFKPIKLPIKIVAKLK